MLNCTEGISENLAVLFIDKDRRLGIPENPEELVVGVLLAFRTEKVWAGIVVHPKHLTQQGVDGLEVTGLSAAYDVICHIICKYNRKTGGVKTDFAVWKTLTTFEQIQIQADNENTDTRNDLLFSQYLFFLRRGVQGPFRGRFR